jgi:hypothetical protein
MSKGDKKKKSGYTRDFKNLEDRNFNKDPFIVFSLRFFDRSQGQNFKDWEDNELLAKTFTKIHEVSNLNVNEAKLKSIIKCYEKVDFPPNSKFNAPKHVPNNITWCSFHIQGKECVIGFFEDNIFYIVFLDKNHEFWPSNKS